MRANLFYPALFSGVLMITGLVTGNVEAEPNQVTFPSIEQLTHYTTVERGNTVEHMLTSKEALAAIKAGSPIPTGTHLVLQDFQSGELYRYLVAQKLESDPASWQYQWFWPNGSVKADERPEQCYACHRSREAQQFMFTHDAAVEFDG